MFYRIGINWKKKILSLLVWWFHLLKFDFFPHNSFFSPRPVQRWLISSFCGKDPLASWIGEVPISPPPWSLAQCVAFSGLWICHPPTKWRTRTLVRRDSYLPLPTSLVFFSVTGPGGQPELKMMVQWMKLWIECYSLWNIPIYSTSTVLHSKF